MKQKGSNLIYDDAYNFPETLKNNKSGFLDESSFQSGKDISQTNPQNNNSYHIDDN